MVHTIILLTIIYILNAIDYLQTTYAIQHLGIIAESNPIMRFLFEHDCAWVAKLILPAVLLVALGFIIKTDKALRWNLYVIVVFYFILIMHNFNVLVQSGLL